MDVSPKQAKKLLKSLEKEKRNLILYSGEISRQNINEFLPVLVESSKRERENLSLVLATYGGDSHAAYRLTRWIQDLYGNFRIVVTGPCKSAGTLVAVGASDLAMGLFGELGPLDVQFAKDDEIAVSTSGLDTLGALGMLQSEAFATFERYMVSIVGGSGSTISTKTACEVAGNFVVGLFRPIASQIDPHRLSEVDRRMKIAKEYGNRLGGPNLKAGGLNKLIQGYPAHEFVIDHKEAAEVFSDVHTPSSTDLLASQLFPDLIMYPQREVTIIDIIETLEHLASSTAETAEDPPEGDVDGVGGGEGDSGEATS